RTRTEAARAWLRHAAAIGRSLDAICLSDTRDDDAGVLDAVEPPRRQFVGAANGEVEETPPALVVDDADQGQIRTLQDDIRNFGHITGAIEHDSILSGRVVIVMLED